MHRMRMAATVEETDAQQLALLGAQRRPRDAAVVGPRREFHAGGDLDLLLAGGDRPLTQDPPARKARRPAPIEVAYQRVRVKAIGHVIDRTTAKAGVPIAADAVSGVGLVLGSLRRLDVVRVRYACVQTDGSEAEGRHAACQQCPSSQRSHIQIVA